jgi:hypothetical protein
MHIVTKRIEIVNEIKPVLKLLIKRKYAYSNFKDLS